MGMASTVCLNDHRVSFVTGCHPIPSVSLDGKKKFLFALAGATC
jgi:hypothetical protein